MIQTRTLGPRHPINTIPVDSSSVGNVMCFSTNFSSKSGTAFIHGLTYGGNGPCTSKKKI